MESKRGLTFTDVQRIKRGTQTYDIFLFPNTDVEIGIRLLTQDEIIKASQRAQQKTEKMNLNMQVTSGFELREILFKSCLRIPDEGFSEEQKPFFESPEQIGMLSIDEIATLASYYEDVQKKYAPEKEIQTAEEFQELVDEIKKKSPRGMSLSSHMLRKLIVFMDDGQVTSQKDNGSISLPLSQRSENSKTELHKQAGIKLAQQNL